MMRRKRWGLSRTCSEANVIGDYIDHNVMGKSGLASLGMDRKPRFMGLTGPAGQGVADS